MNTQDYIYAGFTKGGGTPDTPNWQLIPNTPEARREAIERGYDAFSIMSLLHAPENGKPEPLRRGPVILDFDCKGNPEKAVEAARYFIKELLKRNGLDPDHLRYWLSGGKGVHIEIPASLLGSEEGHPYLHKIYKLLVCFLQIECLGCFRERGILDMQMYCGGQGRLLREENIKRPDNGRYKVPVSAKEFLELKFDELWKLTEQPRIGFETGHKAGQINSGLAEKYQRAKEIIEMHSTANPISVLEAMSKCAFFCNCIDKAEILTEPEWWVFISNLVPLENLGRELAHWFSCSYPGYSVEETDKKFNKALKEETPKTCDYIRQQGWVQCPGECNMKAPCKLFLIKNIAKSTTNFINKEDGLYYNEDGRLTKICSPIRVITRGCDFDNWNWCRELEITDQTGHINRCLLPMRELAETGVKWLSRLYSAGLVVETFPKARNLLREYIEHGEPEEGNTHISDKIGWMPNGGYLLPDICFGSDVKTIFTGTSDNKFQTAGSLEAWQNHVGQYCEGNSLLVLATSYALTGIMLEILGCEGGGLHIYGGSSKGKSTIAVVAGSVCGGGKDGFINQWRTTDNALEKVAANHNDNLLVLDEVGQVNSYALSNLAYMLPNQKGKLRMRADGENRRQFSWNLNFLSTGELTISDKIMEDGRLKSYAGQEVRIIDLPVDGGQVLENCRYQHPFLDLHDAATPGKLSDMLKHNALTYYGSPMRAFLTKIIADRENSIAAVRKVMENFEKFLPKDAGGQVQRALKKFALIAGTGELAIEMGIFPYEKGEATRAAREWFNIWVKQRNGSEDSEIIAALGRICEEIDSSSGLYINLEEARLYEGSPPRPIPGYKCEEAGRTVFYILKKPTFNRLCGSVNTLSVLQKLKSLGCLVTTGRGTILETISIAGKTKRVVPIIANNLPPL